MSLGSVVLSTVIWSAAFQVIIGGGGGGGESFHDNRNHRRNRHKYHRRQLLFSGENANNGYARGFHERGSPPLQRDAPSSDDGDEDAAGADSTFELDKPLPVEQVAVPVGGKAYLPCDTSSGRNNDESSAAADSSGFFMVMWFKERKEISPEDESYGRSATTPSTSGEPIFTYDTRQSSAKISNLPRSWSSPVGFGDRAYFHSGNSNLQHDQDVVDHLTVDRALATDTGVYRCRVDFFRAPTQNRLVNLTVIIAPDRPKIYFEYGNSIGGDRPENYQQDSGNVIVIDEGSPTVTLVCRVNGGWPRPRLTWYHENAVLDSTYQLLTDEDNFRGYRKKQNNLSAIVTVNRLLLTNLTRWHPIMSQRQQPIGTARLTCQASNSISNGYSRPSIVAANGNMPPPAATEHTYIRLNLKPTEVQIISIKENANKLGRNENHSFEKNEVFASEDAIGHKKYTIRADRMYRAECRSKGSRPLATTEWYLLKKNQRYNVGQPMDSTDAAAAASSSPNVLSEDIQKSSNTILVEGTIAGLVETQQTPSITTDKDEMVITTSILHFTIRGPKSAVTDENDDGESILVCRAYNPVIKTSERQYVETKITLDVQYPPVVELRFGNRMLDTGRIGPGDDVYFECVARANPSNTIRYSWYHNGIRLIQDTEKKRTDDGDKKGEKGNSRLASRVIQYSQLGSLVLQSVKTAAAGKYACQATNGIEIDSNENKTMSNTVRLLVKHVPVCQHREDILIVTKKSDTVSGPTVRCRAGRGHPPTIEYHWTFYPEQTEMETRNGNPLESNEMTFTGRSVRELDSMLTQTAVQGNDGGISYTFITTTPILKSYLSAVSAAISASPNAVHSNYLHGRLECRAVNTMGKQIRPCVYRITDKTSINQDNKDLQEITDCRPIPRKDLSTESFNNTATMTYPCSAQTEDIVTSTNRKIRFCITCTLSTSSWHPHKQRLNYILQLYKTARGETPSTALIAYNITGVITEDNGNGKTNFIGQDDTDYYLDTEDEDISNDERSDYNLDTTNVAQKVVFVIDDDVEPGIYRGKIYNNDKGTLSTTVKGIINVATVTFDNINENDNPSNYIIDDVENDSDESIFGYTWRRVTVALVEIISLVMPQDTHEEFDNRAHRKERLHRHWHAASVVLTAILVAVVIALSCGICGVIAVLYRRQHYNHRGDNQSHVYGLRCNNGDVDEDDISEGTEKMIVVGEQNAEVVPQPPAISVGAQDQHQPPMRACRRLEYGVDDASNNCNADVLQPLLQLQLRRQPPQYQSNNDETKGQPSLSVFPIAAAAAAATANRYTNNNNGTDSTNDVIKNTKVGNRENSNSGPDIVMSTATTLANNNTDRPSGNWQQKHRQMKFDTTNSTHQWPLQRLEFQKSNMPTSHSKAATLSTTITPSPSAVLTNKNIKPKTIRTLNDEPRSISPQVLLNALHRESSI